jgi:hypothetical protein
VCLAEVGGLLLAWVVFLGERLGCRVVRTIRIVRTVRVDWKGLEWI